MRHETADDERSEQWADSAHRWTNTSAEPREVAALPRPVPDGARNRRSRHDRKPAAPLLVRVDDVSVDDQCRRTLRKLAAAGCIQANVPYSIEHFQVAEQDLQYLKQHGVVHAEASTLLQPMLLSYERQKAGADVGKITVILNVNLV
ncbi:hypothetical protein [Pseudoduganella lutea]|uniref:Uncharacterized protein n=1 Tax=Pseudoduganella lutea TaxID=321985 RepID=A0A4P6L6E2_9BURK|nr:hypothetical protein [Pseudoduganella lutea]QBE66442.1 hypothetical protein EWM63_28625 [Pseudoduganella lutea]